MGIAVCFEKENINTLDAKGEVMITIMASIAQQESQSISDNVKMGIRYGMQEGYGRLNWEEQTLEYYDRNTEQFVSRTVNADMGETQRRFISRIPTNGLILDFGCGSGRDTKAFLEAGYHVEAMDGSKEVCRKA